MRVGLTWSRDQGLNILEDFPSLLNYRSSAAPAVPRFCLCLTSRRYQKTWRPPSKDDEWWRATRRRQPACKDSGAKKRTHERIQELAGAVGGAVVPQAHGCVDQATEERA